MMIKLALVTTLAALAVPAHADDAATKAEAQKKIDDAKIKGCEAVKTALGKNKMCPDQGAAAAKVTCTPAAFAEVTALNDQCVKLLKDKATAAKDKAVAAKDRPPASADRPCKASDEGGASVLDATSPKLTACMKDAKAAGEAKCTAGVKKLKLTYTWGDSKPMSLTVRCKA
jgi:hypothetical protein